MNTIIVPIIFSAVMLAVAFRYRRAGSVDEYTMGGRAASKGLVGSALFTLVGGGELVTLVMLAAIYGYAALSLFAGYAIGFALLSYLAPKIREIGKEQQFISLPDFMSYRVGKKAGLITFIVSAAAFFAMLVIQFTAGGQLLAPLLKVTYVQAVLVVGAVACSYLVIGGFRTVLTTDVIQGVARFLLLPIIIYAVSNLGQAQSVREVETLPFSVWISFVITGVFSAAASADVWQRIYAAKSNSEARYGLLFGGAIILAFGAILIELGLAGSAAGVISSPETGFQDILQAALPGWVSLGAVLLVLCTVVGTADTEIFLLAGMFRNELSRLTSARFDVNFVRAMVVAVTAAGIAVACFVTDLVQLYSWLLSAVMTISPFILIAIYRPGSDRAVAIGMGLVVAMFVCASYVGFITLENAYYIIIPGAVVASIVFLKSRGTNERNRAKP